MNATESIASILTLLTGIGIFLTACTMISAGFRRLSGDRIKNIFAKIGNNKFAGLCIGTAATAAVQSSGAITVAVIGLADSGIITLMQSATLIYGANIGTTVTGQLAALGVTGNGILPISLFLAAPAGIGAFVLAFARSERTKNIGVVITGFGMMFAALHIMSDAAKFFSSVGALKNFITKFDDPILLVLTGAAITAVIQSSSVVTSMTITMTGSGLIPLGQCVYITLGANIGACVTSLIAGIPQGGTAKKAALLHLFFNVGGTALFLSAGLIMRCFGVDYGLLLGRIFPQAPHLALASFHTFFNVVTALIALPLTTPLVGLVNKLGN